MKPSENEHFSIADFNEIFNDEKLSPQQQLIKYGFVSGWLIGLFSDRAVYEKYQSNGKKFQDAYMEILNNEFKKFQEKVKF